MNLADHLWQSTAFALIAGLMTLAFRANGARVRHWLWFAASVKFLIPLSVFIGLGQQIEIKSASVDPNVTVAVQQIVEPFTVQAVSAAPPTESRWPDVLFGMWLVGVLGISSSWLVRWLRIRAMVRSASPWEKGIKVSDANFEPGVFGIFRPVLVLPSGIFDRLTPAQLRAIIAHEMCHIRHRDNLLAAIHMFVETIFWFHPLVWWIGKRMVEERELACDEEVLRTLGEPQAYAEGILNVCKLYVESPLPCVSGVTGADLKRRIEAIMKNRRLADMNAGKKLILATAGMLVLALPIAIGTLRAQALQFDAASIKLGGDWFSTKPQISGGRMTWTTQLAYLIGYAHGLDFSRVSGAKKGLGTVYSIEAVFDAKASEQDVQSMLRGLLNDRFKLKSHIDTAQAEGYAFSISKGGAKLPQAKSDGERYIAATIPGRGIIAISARGATMEQLAVTLQRSMKTPIWDRTGLTGSYDFEFRYAGNPDSASDADAPWLGTALRDRLGLSLEKSKGPSVTLVVDQVEGPSEN